MTVLTMQSISTLLDYCVSGWNYRTGVSVKVFHYFKVMSSSLTTRNVLHFPSRIPDEVMRLLGLSRILAFRQAGFFKPLVSSTQFRGM